MKQRLLCILLILSMAFTIMPVFGASASGGSIGGGVGGGGASSGGTTAASSYLYGVIQEVWYDDYTLEDGYVEVSIAAVGEDDFYLGGNYLALLLPTTINGTTCSTAEAVAAALPVGAAVRYTMGEVNIYDNVWMDGISSITVDTTGISYTDRTYNPSTGLFSGMNSSTASLPVLRKDAWTDEDTGENYVDIFPAYLDGNHTYDIEVYDYAIMVTAMWATSASNTIDYAWLENSPNGDFLADFKLYIQSYAPGCSLHAEVYNAAGTKLQSTFVAFDEYEATAVFTDLPDEEDFRTIKAWIASGNRVVSPVYEYTYFQRAFDIVSGKVTQITDTSNGWSRTARVILETSDGDTERLWCSLPTYVEDTLCKTVADLQAAIPVGTYVQAASGDNCAFKLGAPIMEIYGMIALATTVRDSWNVSKYTVMVRIFLPDGTYYDCSISEDLTKDIDDLNAYCKSLIGSCGIFFGDEKGVVVDMNLDYTGTSYENKRYLSSGKFEGQKELPIYYYADGKYQAPVVDGESILNEDAIYNITVYDHGIIITDMKYAEIDVLTIVPETNLDFTQDIVATYGIWEEEESNITLNIQLLDDRGKLLEEQSTKVDNSDTAEPYLYFRNYPNENLTYHIKAWITDENGKRISPIYTEADLGIENIKNGVKTTEQAISRWIIQSVEKKNSSVELSIKWTTPTLQESKTLSCNAYTNINGKTYSSMDELAGLFKEGMLIEYADNYVYQKVIRFSTEKQQVVTDASYDETKNEVTATVTLVSNDAAKDDESVVTGVVYAGVYSKNGILKGITTIPATQLKADGTANNVSVTVEGIAYEAGDYIKAFFWNGDNNAAISNAATAKIAQ